MITLPKVFFGVLATGLPLAVACDSEKRPPKQSECPRCDLRERIASAQSGDTINIAAGVYTMTGGELVIDKNLTLIGAGSEKTIIQGATSWGHSAHRVINIHEESVVSIS